MYKVSSGLRSTQNQDGTIVLDIERGRILRLNPTGSVIFECLQLENSVPQIIDRISQTSPASSIDLRNSLTSV